MASKSSEKAEGSGGGLYGTVKLVAQALLLALIVRSLLFQTFHIPSGSMKDTLLIGDHLLVSKYSYGYSRHSFPFGFIPFSGRILSTPPERGDVAVFKTPQDNSTDFIKRVVGLPGDEIQVTAGILHINGEAVARERIENFVSRDAAGRTRVIPRYVETLPNGVSYHVLDEASAGPLDNTGIYKVPPGHYFMMGDNRDRSSDSRILDNVGYVPLENFVGRAEVIYFSLDTQKLATEGYLELPWAVRWNRIFNKL